MVTIDIQGGDIPLKGIRKDRHYPAAATDATKTIAAIENIRHVLNKIIWSYSDAPTGGRLTVIDGATTVLDIDITNGGPGALTLMEPMAINSAMVITLASGGGAVVGKLQFTYFSTQI